MKSLSRTAGSVLVAVMVSAGLSACNSAKSGWSGPDPVVAEDSAAVSAATPPTGGDPPSAAPESSAESGGGASASSSDSSDSAGPATGASSNPVPSVFPMPTGATAVYAGTSEGAERWLVTISGTPAAYKFWVSELPKAGFTISDKSQTSGTAQISFSGNGYTEGKLSIVGTLAALRLVK